MAADPAWYLRLSQYETLARTISWIDDADTDVTLTGSTVTGRRAAYDPDDPDTMTGAAALTGTFSGMSGNDVTYTPSAADVATIGQWWLTLKATNGARSKRGLMVISASVPES